MIFSRNKLKSSPLDAGSLEDQFERKHSGNYDEDAPGLFSPAQLIAAQNRANSLVDDAEGKPWTVAGSAIPLREDRVIENPVPFIPTSGSASAIAASAAASAGAAKPQSQGNLTFGHETSPEPAPASASPGESAPSATSPVSSWKVPISDLSIPAHEDLKRRFGSNIRSALGVGTVIEGTFRFDTPVCIDGTLNGIVASTSVLIAGAQASVTAEIKVGSLIVLGQVIGDVEAADLVEIRAGGNLEGDISTRRLVIEDGGVFNGKVSCRE